MLEVLINCAIFLGIITTILTTAFVGTVGITVLIGLLGKVISAFKTPRE